MATRKFRDLAVKKLGEQRVGRIEHEVEDRIEREDLEANLKSLREITGRTQAEVADALKLSQAELSRQERRDDHLLSTLRRYVEVLGGELEVIARFGDKSVRLKGV